MAAAIVKATNIQEGTSAHFDVLQEVTACRIAENLGRRDLQ